MDTTQSMRLLGRTDIEEITVERICGENVVFWEDIEVVFPGIQRIKNGRATLSMLRSSDGHRLVPHRIKYRPGVDVVLFDTEVSTQEQLSNQGLFNDQAASSTMQLAAANLVQDHMLLPRSERQSSTVSLSAGGLSPAIMAAPDTLSAAESQKPRDAADPYNNHQPGVPLNPNKLPPISNATPITSPVATDIEAATDRPHFQQSMVSPVEKPHISTFSTNKMAANADKPTIIQEKAEAIFTQHCDIDSAMPRFFIVLPETPAPWDQMSMAQATFRLYFICACDEHTKHTKSTKLGSDVRIARTLHIPSHEGYIVRNPISLFREHGPFLLVALETFKEILANASATYPIATGIGTDVSERVEYSLQYLKEVRFKVQDYTSAEVRSRASKEDLRNYLSGVEVLGKATLNQIGPYLIPNGPGKFLGNIFRIVAEDGRLCWVCREKYRHHHHEKNTQDLYDVVELAGGEFNEQLGTVGITKNSGVPAAELYDAMQRAKRSLSLGLYMSENNDVDDFESLILALTISGVLALHLDLSAWDFQRHVDETVSITTVFMSLRRIQQILTMRSITVSVSAMNYVDFLSFQSDEPHHSCKVRVELAYQYYEKKKVQAIAEALMTDSALAVLSDNGAKALAAALRSNSTLIYLSLQENHLKETGANALANALKTNSALTTLVLTLNRIGPQGAQAMALALKENSTLTTLNLENNGVEDIGAKALSEALKTNSTLVNLALGTNSIGRAGTQALFEALEFNSSLVTLSLEDSSFAFIGLKLAKSLLTNSTLLELRLDGCIMLDEDLEALAEALKVNSTLEALYLQSNIAGDGSAQVFAEALKVNRTLRILDLDNNKIGSIGALALLEALKMTECNVIFAMVK
ncbi:hypothetical protein EMPS_08383 [Entomortierella parvispora]|uniref:RNI-like protein n=1 Tax=Entomortierella parvispora TaxID=205924 RepID=A0A9P3HGA4_9FUNG|nr:hypothetical protein EMPS_08383 [Entomortierella parvispora]